jgi:CDP-6-deoxy-D-xylo-4-hexulose-3-dehydrase
MAQEHKKIWYAPNKFEAYGQEEIDAVNQCLKDGWLAPGPLTDKFEKGVAEHFGKKFGVMVNSGSSANLLGLAALELEKGFKVITPALTFSTTVAPIVQLGGVPIFVDAEFPTYVPSVDAVLTALKANPDTKVIMLPNLVGSKPNWAKLREEVDKVNPKIVLFEDSADTMTHTTCTDIAICSFYASHIITAGGGGGMVMFNSETLRNKALMFRDWGRIGNNSEDMSERFNFDVDGIPYDFKFLYGVLGYNFKSTEMNAAFGLVQLAKLPKFKLMRRQNIKRYITNLTGQVPGLILPADLPIEDMQDWLAMPFMHPERKALLNYLENHNIQTRVMFAGNITRHPAYKSYFKVYPNADQVMKEGFLLGAHHGLTFDDIDHVCKIIKAWKPSSADATPNMKDKTDLDF